MDSDFYQRKEMCFTEVGEVLEDFYYLSKGKIYIGSLIPEIPGGSPMRTSIPKPSTSNILNKEGSQGISSATVSNYVELYVPKYIGSLIKDINQNIKKGTEFLIEFAGGEINKPVIVALLHPEQTF